MGAARGPATRAPAPATGPGWAATGVGEPARATRGRGEGGGEAAGGAAGTTVGACPNLTGAGTVTTVITRIAGSSAPATRSVLSSHSKLSRLS